MSGSVIGTINRIQTQQGRPHLVEISMAFVADAIDASFPVTVINTLTDVARYDLRGVSLNAVFAIPGTPAPTTACELTITNSNGFDLMGGKGLDFISDVEKTWTCFGPLDWFMPVPITDNISVNLSGNLVNEAALTLIVQLIGV